MASKYQETGVALCDTGSIAYTIHRSARRTRTISFLFESESCLRIVAPLKVHSRTITSLLQQKASWISERLKDLRANPPQLTSASLHDGATILYLGYPFRLTLQHEARIPQGCHVRPRSFLVNIPDSSLAPKDQCEEVRLEMTLWMKKRGRKKLEQRLELWAKRLNLRYQKMVITNSRGRWGSCNYKNVIRLNWRLIMMPLAILDYVVVHELAHIVHKNHSPRFWQYVADAMPDYKARRQTLKRTSGQFML